MAQGHHDRLEKSRASIKKRCIGHIHAGQAADRGLVLERGLQGSLRCFGLVRGIGGIEFAAAGKGIDGRGNVVIVEACSAEIDQVGGVFPGNPADMLHHFHFGEAFGHVELLRAQIGGYGRKKLIKIGNAQLLEHTFLILLAGCTKRRFLHTVFLSDFIQSLAVPSL